VITAAVLVYVVVTSLILASADRPPEVGELLLARGAEVIIVLWVLWASCSIGSFLNVVAWRMPRGQSIGGRSICPHCGSKLPARDNIPVLSYLALGGRCRACAASISIRYPLVELLVGVSITAVVVGELFGFSLPHRSVHDLVRPSWAVPVSAPLVATTIHHAVALSVVWACGVIRLDGYQLPTQLVWVGMLLIVVPMLVFPELMIVPWQADIAAAWRSLDASHIDALLRVITAVAAGVFWGRLLGQSFCGGADPKLDPLGKSTARLIDLIAILTIAIIVVGWQASPGLLVITMLLAIASKPLPLSYARQSADQRDVVPSGDASDNGLAGSGTRQGFPPAAHQGPPDPLARFAIALPIALTVQLAAWRPLHEAAWYPSDGSSPWVFLGWSLLVVVIGWLTPRKPDDLAIR